MHRMPLAGRPPPDTAVPAAIARVAEGRPVVPVWRNQLGGVTFAVGDELHVKWQPASSENRPEIDLGIERRKLEWLRTHARVPAVLGHGADADGRWLITETIPGWSAVDPRWTADPANVVAAIGTGLRHLHDSVPVATCPFDWSAERRIQASPPRSPARTLPSPPPIDRLVVCHGDPCAPNTIVDRDGHFVGHVDLASAGVADRWADLAVASWSLEWNYGRGWEPLFFGAYGIDPDPLRIDWYRRLWDT